MNIFFFITSAVVVAVGILIALILWRVLRILGYVEEISKDMSEESGLIRDDIAHMRGRIKTEGFKLRHLATIASLVRKHITPKHKKSVE